MRRILAFFAASSFCVFSSSSVFALDYSVFISSDLRGADYSVKRQYSLFKSGERDGDQSSGFGSDANKNAFTNSVSLGPTLHLSVSRPVYELKRLVIGFKADVVHLSLGVNYPDGLGFRSGDQNILVPEPTQINLKSYDIGGGPFFNIDLTPRISLGGEFMSVSQKVIIKTSLGRWNLNDSRYQQRNDASLWVNYKLANNNLMFFAQPSMQLSLTQRYDDTFINFGIQMSL